MAIKDLKHHQLTGNIIACAMNVHHALGPGFREIIYKRALIIEFSKASLPFVSELPRDIFYSDKLVGKAKLDLLVDDVVLLELKSTRFIRQEDFNQLANYLRVFRIEVGLLLNFGSTSLHFKRCINTIPRNPIPENH